MKCIYCKTENLNLFKGVEHVIPQSFGNFGTDTPTLSCVCDSCNAYFAKELDLMLARETLEGITRYKMGIFSRETRPQKSLHFTLGEEAGEFAGVVVEGVDGRTGKLMLPLPQVHLRDQNSNRYHGVLIQDIASLNWKTKGYSDKDIKVFGRSDEDRSLVIEELKKIGINYKEKAEIQPAFVNGKKEGDEINIQVNIEGVIGHVTKRALIKVILNFAAFYLGHEELFKGVWDKARNYVRFNKDPLGGRLSNKPFWGDETETLRYRNDSCNIRVENDEGNVIGTIQFYNLYTYQFKLVENYSIGKEVAARFTPGKKPFLGAKFVFF